MKYTNKENLPIDIFIALTHSDYTKGNADFTASQITNPQQQVVLCERYKDELTEDAANLLWRLLGTAVHYMFSRHSRVGAQKERRIEHGIEVDGKKYIIGGGADLYDEERFAIDDYKTTRAYALLGGPKPEWVIQTNVYAWLWRKCGFAVKELNIRAVVRDRDKRKSLEDRNYPQSDFCSYPIQILGDEIIENYIKERIRLFTEARLLPDDLLPECTEEERWVRGSKWAVTRPGRKVAIRVFDNEEEAKERAEKEGSDAFVEFRPGKAYRCDGYCVAAPFCQQLKRLGVKESE